MQRVIHSFFYLTATAAALTLLIGLRVLITDSVLAVEWKLTLLLGAALICLLIGMAGMAIFFHLRPQSLARPPLALLFLLAYLVPMTALLLPEWIIRWNTPDSPGAVLPILSLFSPSLTTVGQPWYFLWQVSILAVYALLRLGTPAQPQYPGQRPALRAFAQRLEARLIPGGLHHWNIVLGTLSGLGVWLLAAFITGLLRPSFSLAAESSLPGLLRATVLIAALMAAPLVETSLYWGIIQPALQKSLSPRLSAALTALLFAALQFRPLLFFPAILLGLAQYNLTRRTGQLLPAVLAQMVFNLCMFLLGWYMVV